MSIRFFLAQHLVLVKEKKNKVINAVVKALSKKMLNAILAKAAQINDECTG